MSGIEDSVAVVDDCLEVEDHRPELDLHVTQEQRRARGAELPDIPHQSHVRDLKEDKMNEIRTELCKTLKYN